MVRAHSLAFIASWLLAGSALAQPVAESTNGSVQHAFDPLGTPESLFADYQPMGDPTLADPALANDPAAAQAAQAAAMQEAMTELGTAVETIGKRLTVLTVSDEVKVIIGGQIVADFMYHRARPLAPGTPFLLLPASPFGFEQDTFDAHARQSALNFLVMGPKICDLDSEGVVVLSLYNDAVIVDRYGILPILAYGQLKNDYWKFSAGLNFDIFNPLNPTVLPFSMLFGSGNSGIFRGQARVENYFYPTYDSQITLTAGIGDATPSLISNDFELSEDSGWPNVEGRASLGLGPLQGEGPLVQRPFEMGISGVVGQIRNTVVGPPPERILADVWGVGSDFRDAFTDRCGVKAEVYYGQTLGTYGGGVLQSVNSTTFEPIRSVGGWGEFYYYLVPECLHTHMGYAIDDPRDGDVALGQIMRNETYFANLIWDVNKFVRVAGELTYRETTYNLLPDNEGIGFHTQFMWKF